MSIDISLSLLVITSYIQFTSFLSVSTTYIHSGRKWRGARVREDSAFWRGSRSILSEGNICGDCHDHCWCWFTPATQSHLVWPQITIRTTRPTITLYTKSRRGGGGGVAILLYYYIASFYCTFPWLCRCLSYVFVDCQRRLHFYIGSLLYIRVVLFIFLECWLKRLSLCCVHPFR